MSKVKDKTTINVLKRTVELCRKIKAMAEETGNCGVCSEEFDDHELDGKCPYPLAVELLKDVEAMLHE